MKLIDPNEVKQLFQHDACISTDTDADKDYVRELIDAIPTIDAEPVVRCKDCRWGMKTCGYIKCMVGYNGLPEYHEYDWFCPDGENKDEVRK